MSEPLRKTISDELLKHGWTLDEGSAIASKFYATAVGKKQAHLYLTGKDASGCSLIVGEYFSEGRNALEPHAAFVPGSVSHDQIQGIVARFARNADAVIAQTYAVKLLHG